MSQLRRAYIASDVEITGNAMKVLQETKNLSIPDYELQFAFWEPGKPAGVPVLSLGTPAMDIPNRTVIAPSVAQLVTKADALTRMGYAFKLLVDPPVLPEMHYRVLDTVDSAVSILRGTCGLILAVDIELSGVVDEDLVESGKIISLSFTAGDMNYVLSEEVLQDAKVRSALGWLISHNLLVAHNAKFDLKYLEHWAEAKANLYFDTLLASYALFPASGEHGLKALARRYFGAPDWDSANKVYLKGAQYEHSQKNNDGSWASARKYPVGSGYERIPRAMLYEYNAADTYWTWNLYELLSGYVKNDSDVESVLKRRHAISSMFMDVERRGFTIDIAYLENLRAELEADKVRLQAELCQVAGREINPNSPVQVKAWFAETDKVLPGRKDSAGKVKPSSSEDALKEVIEKGAYSDRSIDFAKKLLECRSNTKNLGTYVNGFLDRAHGKTIFPTFNISGPITGRLANRGAGIMTIPRDERLRRMVVPSEQGRVLVKPDYGQLEMRIVAALSGDKRFIAAFQPGMPDFFTTMLPEVFPDVDFSSMTKSEKAPYRTQVKPFSHGLNYGRGYEAIAKALEMPLDEALRIATNYLGPKDEGLAAWQTEVKRKAVEGEPLVTPYGFHLQSEIVTSRNRSNVENSALSFLPQSTGNDICLGAALRIHEWLHEYDAWIVATIHDQIICDVPIPYAKEVGERMEAEMVQEGRNVFGDLLVFEAAPEYGFNWAEKMEPEEWDAWLEENGYA